MDTDTHSLVCIQDVDYTTDYSTINIEELQKKELNALAFVHSINHGLIKDLHWLPLADRNHVTQMINKRWKPSWEAAKENEQFMDEFGVYVPLIEAVSTRIVDELEIVINDENSLTLIHNDLNPGNVLVHNNSDVYFIDWEDSRYGSLFLDVPLRCNNWEQAERYRDALSSLGVEIPIARFKELYCVPHVI